MSDFWSRRRAAVQAEEQAQEVSARALRAAEDEARLEDRDDAELLAEAGLPDPDLIETSEEVQAFLRSALPQRLKTRALRRLWRMNPVLACLDGLNDYDGDFTDAAHMRADMKTAYQVGRGILREILEEPAPEVQEPAAETGTALARADAPDEAPVPEVQPEATAPDTPAPRDPQQDYAAPAPRRMRFSFET